MLAEEGKLNYEIFLAHPPFRYILPTKQDSLALQMSKERCDLFYFEDGGN